MVLGGSRSGAPARPVLATLRKQARGTRLLGRSLIVRGDSADARIPGRLLCRKAAARMRFDLRTHPSPGRLPRVTS